MDRLAVALDRVNIEEKGADWAAISELAETILALGGTLTPTQRAKVAAFRKGARGNAPEARPAARRRIPLTPELLPDARWASVRVWSSRYAK